MAELALKPRSGFEDLAIPGRYGVALGAEPQVIILERPNLVVAQLSAFRGKREDAARAVFEIAGLELPEGPKRAAVSGLTLIGMAPSQWLSIADGAEGRARLSRLSEALSGLASVVDQSDAKAILRVSGPRLRDALAKGCALDLHPRAFGFEDAATTQIALIPCQIWQLDDAPTFELAVPLSYARSFWSWLTASAGEFGYEVRTRP